jgi:hypothetical protein
MLVAPIALYAILFAAAGQPEQPDASGASDELPAILVTAARASPTAATFRS